LARSALNQRDLGTSRQGAMRHPACGSRGARCSGVSYPSSLFSSEHLSRSQVWKMSCHMSHICIDLPSPSLLCVNHPPQTSERMSRIPPINRRTGAGSVRRWLGPATQWPAHVPLKRDRQSKEIVPHEFNIFETQYSRIERRSQGVVRRARRMSPQPKPLSLTGSPHDLGSHASPIDPAASAGSCPGTPHGQTTRSAV
jgi:hypothetical protein